MCKKWVILSFLLLVGFMFTVPLKSYEVMAQQPSFPQQPHDYRDLYGDIATARWPNGHVTSSNKIVCSGDVLASA